MKCKVCGCEDGDAFYSSIRTHCKLHWAERVRENRRMNVEHYKSYEKKRAMRPDRVKARAEYENTPAGKAARDRAKRSYITRNPAKRAAHVILGNAVRDGRVEKKYSCEKCGTSSGRIHGHHEDYTRPLDVIWLCAACHSERHKYPIL